MTPFFQISMFSPLFYKFQTTNVLFPLIKFFFFRGGGGGGGDETRAVQKINSLRKVTKGFRSSPILDVLKHALF